MATLLKIKEKEKAEYLFFNKAENTNIETIISRILPEDYENVDLMQFAELILKNVAKEFEVVQGIFYIENQVDEYIALATYACNSDDPPASFVTGETLAGQAVLNKKLTILSEVPELSLKVFSGTGRDSLDNLFSFPLWQIK